MVDNNRIGNKLKALRKAKNLTTEELAKKVNISQSYISRFENGRAIPDVDMLERILTSLGTDLSSFFSSDLHDLPEDLIQLIDTVKTLSPEARMKLNEFLKLVKD
ncbi:helix-turn-helix domain-containing protein [Virgibacillus dakarensis]|uniref:helix-turn-helix domain-containing protein n=1 Tax=Virgibacillus dakarensis TaxID=1917889 RepID=UPI000B43AA14|nr:helix-turn-helix transcriptional regulator [Virgibacillus dakarensis]MBT2217964.1 helix-turn-helix domain-containing protein [Virgibacillus dakarensis]